MNQYLILYNPHAAGGHGKENAGKLAFLLPNDTLLFRDITTIRSYPDLLSTLTREDALVLSGGDGTLNRFLNDTACLSLPCPLFYFPGGSGNDFLRDVTEKEAGPLIPMEAYLARLPKVTVNGKSYRFLNGVGYGIDGYCCQEGDRLRGISSKPVNYTSIAIRGLLFHYKPANAVITVDGISHAFRNVWLAPTMNGRYYGGGMMPTPDQDRLNPEGTISTMVFHGSGKLKTLMIFPSIFSGTHVRHTKQVCVLTGHDITVEFDRPTPLQIDGETIPDVTSCRITTE